MEEITTIDLKPMPFGKRQHIQPFEAQINAPPYNNNTPNYPQQPFHNSQTWNPQNNQNVYINKGYPPQPQPFVYSMGGPSMTINIGGYMSTTGTQCSRCAIKTDNRREMIVGRAAIIIMVVLFFTVPILFWLPCVIRKCKDTHIICVRCNYIKLTIPAECRF